MKRAELAKFIDHTLLRPDATRAEVASLCDEAVELGVATVCVSPTFVREAARRLEGTSVGVCTVVGFPSGAHTAETKAHETTIAIEHGATEIDMVMNRGALLDGDEAGVDDEVRAVVDAARGRAVKVILESAALERDQIERASKLCAAAGASFVKTSTGFGLGGATLDAVRTMRAAVGPDLGVKASGGIRDAETALAMIEAGATRIGASATRKILDSLE